MENLDPLTDLAIKLSRNNLLDDDKNKLICRSIRQGVVSASRISLWRFESDRTAIRCLILDTQEGCDTTSSLVLKQHDYPEYFKAILSGDMLSASDARHHASTQCFNEDYFKTYDIYSLLDFIFHRNFTPLGIICCESTGKKVTWSDEDKNIIRRTASIVSMFY